MGDVADPGAEPLNLRRVALVAGPLRKHRDAVPACHSFDADGDHLTPGVGRSSHSVVLAAKHRDTAQSVDLLPLLRVLEQLVLREDTQAAYPAPQR